MNDGIWWFLPSRIRFRIAAVANMTSQTTVRPVPSARRHRACVTMPCSDVDSCALISCCWCGGKMSMTRSIVCAALCVCSVASTRWPVSAAVIAVDTVSRSRISPTRMMSGSWRSTCFSAVAKPVGVDADLALVDDAALVMVQELDRVLDRDDVVAPRAVGQIDQAGERRGLARTGRPGDQDETAGKMREAADLLGDAEFVQRLDLVRDGAHHRAVVVALLEQVHAEPAQARDVVREVEFEITLEAVPLLGADDAANECRGVRAVSGS